jgi:hypothetical protein
MAQGVRLNLELTAVHGTLTGSRASGSPLCCSSALALYTVFKTGWRRGPQVLCGREKARAEKLPLSSQPAQGTRGAIRPLLGDGPNESALDAVTCVIPLT